MLRKNKKHVEGDQTNEWRKSGSFVNKPTRGWLHPDNIVMGPGVVYSVQYLGCIQVKQSMRILQFDMRTHATKEAIWRVLAATSVAPLPASAKRKKLKDVGKILADVPDLHFSQSYINLTISTASLTLVVSNTGTFIANHQMQSISFASGGDPDTMEYVAYVAKDSQNRRACHVLRCVDGLAQDVINTIGQAFELRFKEYLKNPPKAVTPPDRTEPLFHEGKSRWDEDESPEYYNDLPQQQQSSATSNNNEQQSSTPSPMMSPSTSSGSNLNRFEPNHQPSPSSSSQHLQHDYVNNGFPQQQSSSSTTTTSPTSVVTNGESSSPSYKSSSRPPAPLPPQATKSFEDHNYVNTQPILSSKSSSSSLIVEPPQSSLSQHQQQSVLMMNNNNRPITPNNKMMTSSSSAGMIGQQQSLHHHQPPQQQQHHHHHHQHHQQQQQQEHRPMMMIPPQLGHPNSANPRYPPGSMSQSPHHLQQQAVMTSQQQQFHNQSVGGSNPAAAARMMMAAAAANSVNIRPGAGKGSQALAVASAIASSMTSYDTDNVTRRFDEFDMKPLNDSFSQMGRFGSVSGSHDVTPHDVVPQHESLMASLENEEWYHGNISRGASERLLVNDGDFLVRESSTGQGQYVLSGAKDGSHKHLLLVDPSGVVRTKDRQFSSVSDLVEFHRSRNLPIVSSGSCLVLRQPVLRQFG